MGGVALDLPGGMGARAELQTGGEGRGRGRGVISGTGTMLGEGLRCTEGDRWGRGEAWQRMVQVSLHPAIGPAGLTVGVDTALTQVLRVHLERP